MKSNGWCDIKICLTCFYNLVPQYTAYTSTRKLIAVLFISKNFIDPVSRFFTLIIGTSWEKVFEKPKKANRLFTKFQSDRGYFSLDLRPLRVKLFYFWCTKSKSPAITLPTYIGPDDSQIKFMRKSNNYGEINLPKYFPVTDSHSIRSQTKQKKFQARKIHGE